MTLKHAIALTGSIGSGKSTLVNFLALYGYKSICADKISHQMLEKHSAEVIEAFGEGITNKNGVIERKKLGAIIFASPKEREKLESILHPYIRQEILTQAKELEKKGVWYFLDIPLFFEVGGKDTFPVARSLVVYTPAKKAIERVMQRDNLTFEEAKMRLGVQMSIDEKCRLADDVIGNDGTLAILQQRIESYLASLNALDSKKYSSKQDCIYFLKYSSNGNDFLIFTTHTSDDSSRSTLAQRVCERHNGIGADGMVAVIPTPNEKYTYKWEFYNADGSRAKMCGNASRSVGHYAYIEGIAPKQHHFLSEVGLIGIEIDKNNPLLVQSDLGAYTLLQEHIIESNPYGVDMWHLLDTGVPHLVGLVRDDLPTKKDKLLKQLRVKYNANVTLARIGEKHIDYMTYERGVEDITQACGTGAAAAFVLAFKNKLCAKEAILIPPSKETLWLSQGEDSHILFKGEVKRIARCEWLLGE
ncbi:diaminopimelate epimerase [Helicobacter japonicus]|uniref:diaminopimelate epimerase n=3 Tax=Helicobacter japonicus TaxID=425400 RepID=UPI0023F34087|nr:diaminopimelate epimerase [Helicobacter japonicus]